MLFSPSETDPGGAAEPLALALPFWALAPTPALSSRPSLCAVLELPALSAAR